MRPTVFIVYSSQVPLTEIYLPILGNRLVQRYNHQYILEGFEGSDDLIPQRKWDVILRNREME